MVACSSIAPQWQPRAVSDFKGVAGKWEGFLTSDDPRALHYDRATLVVDDKGGCEVTITRTITKIPVHYDTVDAFAEKTQLAYRRQTERDIREGRPHDSAVLCGPSKWGAYA